MSEQIGQRSSAIAAGGPVVDGQQSPAAQSCKPPTMCLRASKARSESFLHEVQAVLTWKASLFSETDGRPRAAWLERTTGLVSCRARVLHSTADLGRFRTCAALTVRHGASIPGARNAHKENRLLPACCGTLRLPAQPPLHCKRASLYTLSADNATLVGIIP